jgi:L-gulonolactone oxidase
MSSAAANRVEVLQSQLGALPDRRPHLQSGALWHNWAHVHGDCRPARHHYPTNIEQVAVIVKSAVAAKTGVRVAGAGKSPNASTYTDGHLVHMDHLRRVLKVDMERRTVTAQAGITLKELAVDLAARSLALPVIPSILELTLGGAIATATHATGLNRKSLSGYVRGVRVVDGKGDIHTINATSPIPPSVAKLLPSGSDAKPSLLDAFACNLGVLGIVVEVELALDRLMTVHTLQQPITLEEARKRVDQRATMNEYYRVSWTPHTDGCYEVIGKRMPAADDEAASSVAGTVRSTRSTALRPGAAARTVEQESHLVARATHIVSSPQTVGGDIKHWTEEKQSAAFKAAKAVKGPWLMHDVTENALALACAMPQMQPAVNRTFHRTFLEDTEEAYGPPHEVLALDCLMKQHGIEFAIEAHRWRELLDSVVDIVKRHGLRVHFPVEVRFVDAESTWLAPNSGRKTCYVGVVMYKPKGRNPPDWPKYFALFETAASAMGGRPHWAKTFDTWNYDTFAAAYPHWRAFLELQKLMDPHGVFVNEWFRRISTKPRN